MSPLPSTVAPLAVGYPTMGLVAAVAVGVVAGTVTYGLLRVFDLSDAPPRALAAAVLRRSAGTLPSSAVAAGHLAWALAVLLAVWAGGLALGGLGTDLPSAAVALGVLAGSWWLLTGPVVADGGGSGARGNRPGGDGDGRDGDGNGRDGDDELGADDDSVEADRRFAPAVVRREWALVHAALALAALLAFPVVYYLLLAVVFPPSG